MVVGGHLDMDDRVHHEGDARDSSSDDISAPSVLLL